MARVQEHFALAYPKNLPETDIESAPLIAFQKLNEGHARFSPVGRLDDLDRLSDPIPESIKTGKSPWVTVLIREPHKPFVFPGQLAQFKKLIQWTMVDRLESGEARADDKCYLIINQGIVQEGCAHIIDTPHCDIVPIMYQKGTLRLETIYMVSNVLPTLFYNGLPIIHDAAIRQTSEDHIKTEVFSASKACACEQTPYKPEPGEIVKTTNVTVHAGQRSANKLWRSFVQVVYTPSYIHSHYDRFVNVIDSRQLVNSGSFSL